MKCKNTDLVEKH